LIVCTQCGVSLESPNEKGKVPAGMLGIFLGGFGAHKFYLGYTGPAVFTLITSIVGGILTMGVIYGLMAIVGFIEGIIYLTKSDQEFARIYVKNRKTWF
jgi:TM2 domain-containing membrane protein YozV